MTDTVDVIHDPSDHAAHDGGTAATKAAVRAAVLRRRRAVPADERDRRDAAIGGRLPGALAELLPRDSGPDRPPRVCAYVPDGGEAGGRGLPGMLAAAGAEVWLPVSPASGPLGWARYRGDADLVPGRFGIPIPGSTPRGPALLATADLVLVPSVAVDLSGRRLGRGGGYYDRSLASVRSGTPLVAVLDVEDVLDEVPAEEHDLPVHAALTPDGLHRFRPWHSPE